MKKNDFILAGIVLSAAFFLFLLQKSAHFSDGQGVVAVYREKEQIAVYPLQQDREEVFRSSGGGTNRLVIHDGEAWIEDADCPDGHPELRGISQSIIAARRTNRLETGRIT